MMRSPKVVWKMPLFCLFLIAMGTACVANTQVVGTSVAAIQSQTTAHVSAASTSAVFASISGAEMVSSGDSGSQQSVGGQSVQAEGTETELETISAVHTANAIPAVSATAWKAALRSLQVSGHSSMQIPGHAPVKVGALSSTHGAFSRSAIQSKPPEKTRGTSRQQSYDEQNNALVKGGGSGAAEYVDDFQDSTKGTAEISPPDPGTESPLTFSPGLSFEFADLSEEDFLQPSIHVGGAHTGNGKAQGHQRQGGQGSKKQRGSQISPASKDPFAMPSPLQTQSPGSGLQGQSGLGNSGLNSSGLNSPAHDYFSNLH